MSIEYLLGSIDTTTQKYVLIKLILSVDNETTDLLSAESSTLPQQENERVAAEVAQTKQRHVTNLMEEAMLESRVGRLAGADNDDDGGCGEDECEDDDEFGDEMFLRTGTEVFFFPDEGSATGKVQAKHNDDVMGVSVCLETLEGRSEYNMTSELDETLPQVEEDLGPIPSHHHSSSAGGGPVRPDRRTPSAVSASKPMQSTSDADEDYCIIGDEEKVAFVSII